MATILDLFKSKQTVGKNTDIYGLNGTTIIESRGVIDPSRDAALAASSPNAVADLIGSNISGLAGGTARRPSDTIFKDDGAIRKPVSFSRPTQALLRDAIDPNENYFVKRHPQPELLAAKIKNVIGNPGAAQSAAISVINKYGSKGAAKGFLDGLKKPVDRDTRYGKKFSDDGHGKTIKEDKIYSKFYKDSSGVIKERKDTASTSTGVTDEGNPIYKSKWEQINESVLRSATTPETKAGKTLEDLQKQNQAINTPFVLFKIYGKEGLANSNIILPGTISGLSEDSTPTINSFKYVGSPFNLYRYSGVERSLKFNLKMYFTNQEEKVSMKRNLDKLRALVFPDENISTIEYGKTGNYSPIVFNPNIAKLTINGLYNDLFVILDSLSISVDDNIPWVSLYDSMDASSIKPHPSVFDVSLSMKIIEHPSVKDKKFVYDKSSNDRNQYINYFTGLDEYQQELGNEKAQKERMAASILSGGLIK